MIIWVGVFIGIAIVCAFFVGRYEAFGKDMVSMWWYCAAIGAAFAAVAFAAFT